MCTQSIIVGGSIYLEPGTCRILLFHETSTHKQIYRERNFLFWGALMESFWDISFISQDRNHGYLSFVVLTSLFWVFKLSSIPDTHTTDLNINVYIVGGEEYHLF